LYAWEHDGTTSNNQTRFGPVTNTTYHQSLIGTTGHYTNVKTHLQSLTFLSLFPISENDSHTSRTLNQRTLQNGCKTLIKTRKQDFFLGTSGYLLSFSAHPNLAYCTSTQQQQPQKQPVQ
jgi:hypothetical protein